MTNAEAGDAEIPKALLKRLIKSKLSSLTGADPTRDYQVNKDTLLAFQEAAKTFIHYLTATANDTCRSSRRQTINAEDVFTALQDMEFSELVPQLQEALEEFRADAKEKTKRKAEDKKRKAEELTEIPGELPAGNEPSDPDAGNEAPERAVVSGEAGEEPASCEPEPRATA